MTNIDIKTKTKEGIQAFCEKKKWSRNKLATTLKISGAILSQIDNDNWEGISDEMWLKIHNYITTGIWNTVKTLNFTTILKTCKDARTNAKMIGVIGYSGAGKTTALLHIWHNQPNTYYVRVNKAMLPRQFLGEILRSMGVIFIGNKYDMIVRIAEELNKQARPLLLIDEAGKMSQNVFMYLHDLRDMTAGNAGIVLAGVDYFKTNLEKAVKKDKEGMPEFFRRIIAWQYLCCPLKAEIEAVCKANGLEDEEKIKDLYRVRDYGTLQNAILAEKLLVEQLNEQTI